MNKLGKSAGNEDVLVDYPRAELPYKSALLVLLLCAIIILSQVYGAIPLENTIEAFFEREVTFGLSVVFTFAYALGFIFWGPVADAVGLKRVLILGLLVGCIATLGCGLATNYEMLTACRAVQGFAIASFPPIALAYVQRMFPESKRAFAVSAISTAFLVAGIVGQVGSQVLAYHLGWQAVYIVSGLFIALFLVMLANIIHDSSAKATKSLREQFSTLLHLAWQPNVRFLCVAHMTILLCFVAFYLILGLHFSQLGYSHSQILLIRTVALPVMFLALAVRSVAKVITVWGTTILGFTLILIGLLGSAIGFKQNYFMIGLSVVFVAGVALTIPAMIMLFAGMSGTSHASGMGLNGFVLFVGASLGPVVADLPLEHRTIMYFLAGLSCAALFSMLMYRWNSWQPKN